MVFVLKLHSYYSGDHLKDLIDNKTLLSSILAHICDKTSVSRHCKIVRSLSVENIKAIFMIVVHKIW